MSTTAIEKTKLERALERLKRHQDELRQCERLLEERTDLWHWTTEEIRKFTHFKGARDRFNMRQYIKILTDNYLIPATREVEAIKSEMPKTRAQTSMATEQRQMDMFEATNTIFRAACPHILHYRVGFGQNFDIKKYEDELCIWAASVATIWKLLDATSHIDCQCCFSLQSILPNHHDIVRRLMTDEEFSDKLVNRNTIYRWAQEIDCLDARVAFDSINNIAASLLNKEENAQISELTEESSNISDASPNREGVVSMTSETRWAEAALEKDDALLSSSAESTENDTSLNGGTSGQVYTHKHLRKRRHAPMPLNCVLETYDRHGLLELTIPELGKVITIFIPEGAGNRSYLCRYARTFFQTLLIAQATMAVRRLSDDTRRKKEYTAQHLKVNERLTDLKFRLSHSPRHKYTSKARKRRREEVKSTSNDEDERHVNTVTNVRARSE